MPKDDFEKLREGAVNWWPVELRHEVAVSSPKVLLENSLDEFCETLVSLPQDPGQVRQAIESMTFPQNHFLKHLLVLADFGGEPISRISLERRNLFRKTATGADLDVGIGGRKYSIAIDKFFLESSISNKKLYVDGDGIRIPIRNNKLVEDTALLMLFGAFAINGECADQLVKCDLFQFVGNREALDQFLRRRYIHVSRIVTGADANGLGQVLQKQVATRLRELLGSRYAISPSAQQVVNGNKYTSDILVKFGSKSVAVEVAFQETTNSTIERKANSASARRADLNSIETKSCYVLDGVGVFTRESAVRKILADSDLVVNFGEKGLSRLAELIKQWCEA